MSFSFVDIAVVVDPLETPGTSTVCSTKTSRVNPFLPTPETPVVRSWCGVLKDLSGSPGVLDWVGTPTYGPDGVLPSPKEGNDMDTHPGRHRATSDGLTTHHSPRRPASPREKG